jgi:sulfate permease, SulP family
VGASLIAGLLSGLVTLTYSVSYAAFIFSEGDLEARLDLGMGIALMSAVVVAAVVAWRSSFVFTIAGPDSNASAILQLMAAAVVTQGLSPESTLSTVVVMLALSSITVGASLWIIGLLKQGYLVRFIPYPVLGGFLAGTGWLIATGSFKVMTGDSLDLKEPTSFLTVFGHIESIRLWAPGAILAIVMLVVLKRFKHFMILPSMIVGAVILSHFGFWAFGLSNADATMMGFLYEPFAKEPSVLIWKEVNFGAVAWSQIFSQLGNLFAMTGVVVITILLNSTGIELFAEEDADLNRELSAAGLANICSGLFGGMIGYQSISRSLLNFKAGGKQRMAGVVAAGFCVLFFLGASPLLTAIPKLVLGGLLLYLGLGLLREWVVDGFHKLSRVDYLLVVSILLVIALAGFLYGVGFGLGISMVLFVLSYSKIDTIKHAITIESHRSSFARPIGHQEVLNAMGKSTLILNLQGYQFFGTANSLLDQIKEKIEDGQKATPLTNVILDFRLVSGIDSSVTVSFQKILQIAQKSNMKVYLTDMVDDSRKYFEEANLLDEKGVNGYVPFKTLDYCVQNCEDEYIKSQGLDIMPLNPNIETEIEEMFLAKEKVPRFLKYLQEIKISKGNKVCAQGDEADSMFFISSGLATAQLDIPGGPTIRLVTLGPGTVFGEMGLYSTANRSADVVTDMDSVLYELKSEELEKMQKNDPEMAMELHRFIIRLLSDRVTQTNKKVQHLN